MIDFETVVRNLLVAGFAGSAVKIAWLERPQASALPAITMQVVSAPRDYTHDGWDGLDETRVQIDLWAKSDVALTPLRNRVIAALEARYAADGWVIEPCFLDADRQMPPEDVNGTKVYRRSMDWSVTSRPA